MRDMKVTCGVSPINERDNSTHTNFNHKQFSCKGEKKNWFTDVVSCCGKKKYGIVSYPISNLKKNHHVCPKKKGK